MGRSDAPPATLATRPGTRRFAERFPDADGTHFRQVRGLTLGSIGIGTYRGSTTARYDRRLSAAIICGVTHGCNLIDTARSYRAGRSEVVVGSAIRALSASGIAGRDELIICSKAGYLQELNVGNASSGESAVDGNILGPLFLSREIAHSLDRTGLDAIDIYLLHNPEQHLPVLGARKFYRTLGRCFEILERYVDDKKVGTYGLACWSAFDRNARAPLDLSRVMHAARRTAGNGQSNFGAIETPLNWVYRNPMSWPTKTSLREICHENKLLLIGSSPLLGGRLARLPAELGRAIPGKLSDPQRSIQFARSLPGASATLAGMSHIGHVTENLSLRGVPALRKAFVQRLCSALDRL